MRIARRIIPVTDQFEGERLFVKQAGNGSRRRCFWRWWRSKRWILFSRWIGWWRFWRSRVMRSSFIRQTCSRGGFAGAVFRAGGSATAIALPAPGPGGNSGFGGREDELERMVAGFGGGFVGSYCGNPGDYRGYVDAVASGGRTGEMIRCMRAHYPKLRKSMRGSVISSTA